MSLGQHVRPVAEQCAADHLSASLGVIGPRDRLGCFGKEDFAAAAPHDEPADNPTLARSVGLELPTRPHRHEICASEPLKRFGSFLRGLQMEPAAFHRFDGDRSHQSTNHQGVGGRGVE